MAAARPIVIRSPLLRGAILLQPWHEAIRANQTARLLLEPSASIAQCETSLANLRARSGPANELQRMCLCHPVKA